jgi:hypothetical protein
VQPEFTVVPLLKNPGLQSSAAIDPEKNARRLKALSMTKLSTSLWIYVFFFSF